MTILGFFLINVLEFIFKINGSRDFNTKEMLAVFES